MMIVIYDRHIFIVQATDFCSESGCQSRLDFYGILSIRFHQLISTGTATLSITAFRINDTHYNNTPHENIWLYTANHYVVRRLPMLSVLNKSFMMCFGALIPHARGGAVKMLRFRVKYIKCSN
jgi:hypothetical protein